MAGDWPEAFTREMGLTEADWLRSLPQAVGAHPSHSAPAGAVVDLGAGRLHLAWEALPPRAIALLRFPRLQVRFRFEGVAVEARRAFMERFDVYMHRGGG